jgi:hypothetical protein
MGSATGDGSAAAIRGDPKRQNQKPSTKETGLDASHNARVSLEGREKNFLLTSSFIG